MNRRRLLVITGGHRFDEAALTRLFDEVACRLECEWVAAEQPCAQSLLSPELAAEFAAIVLHDLPGLQLARGAYPQATDPTERQRADLDALLREGVGIVATHHALAGWPTWDAWADTLGGRFAYAPGTLHGEQIPPSGYFFGRYTVEVSAPEHPICAGLEPFELDDELYSCPVFTDNVTPLLVAPAAETVEYVDTYHEVVSGVRQPAAPQSTSSLVAWAHAVGPSRVVYVLPGHSASTMEHPMYRTLLTNACAWVETRT